MQVSDVDELQRCLHQTLTLNEALQSKLYSVRSECEKQSRILRESVFVLQRQLQQANEANSILRTVILQSDYLSHNLASVLNSGYNIRLRLTRKNGVDSRLVQLPITSVVVDPDGGDLQLFSNSSSDSCNHSIYLCSSWSIEIITAAENKPKHQYPISNCFPPVAHFFKEDIRLQTDDGKQIQLFHAQGNFLGVDMNCTFSVTTRNRDRTADGSYVKREKRCVFLTTFFLKVSVASYRNKLMN